MKRRSLLFGALLLTMPGLARGQEDVAQEEAADHEMPAAHAMPAMAGDMAQMHAQMVEKATAAIHAADAAWVEGFNAGDAAAVAALYTEDAVAMPPNAPAMEGRDAIQAGFAEMLSAAGGPQASVTTKNVELMMSPGIGHTALATGGWEMNGADGPHLDHGKFVAVWRQTDEGWKLSHDIWNSDMAPQP